MIAKTISRRPISPPLININVSGGDSLNNGRDSSNTLFLPDCCVVLVRCSAVYTLYWFPSIRRGELRNDGARWMGLLCCSLLIHTGNEFSLNTYRCVLGLHNVWFQQYAYVQ